MEVGSSSRQKSMSSNSSVAGSSSLPRTQTMRLQRTLTIGNFMDPDVVPSSLAQIGPILRVANEIEDQAPRVAFLCRFFAFDKAHKLDPSSSGRGVRQFKTALLHKLEKDDELIHGERSVKSDAQEMQSYYQAFYDGYVKSLESAGDNMDRAQLAKAYQTAAVLFDVLKAVQADNSEPVDPEVEQKAKEVETKKEILGAYNILPLDPGAQKQAIRMLPEVVAAVEALQNIRGLEFRNSAPVVSDTSDVLDWLRIKFGFQKDNVANQRENLILLLANVHIRQIPKPEPQHKISAKYRSFEKCHGKII